ncbi:hypothetical protein NE236_23785 [Actinoallomurus purpureus]|uniref:hypothetical protein n=1 Tax=Actinoallomurus purpureus TaxID=478114 RepID=UPI002092E016|nr:hypothetical protein [Actinoallomurus purpureus]MCO6008004.1 hypothetical protein [Actinoallomurus purpureus]
MTRVLRSYANDTWQDGGGPTKPSWTPPPARSWLCWPPPAPTPPRCSTTPAGSAGPP